MGKHSKRSTPIGADGYGMAEVLNVSGNPGNDLRTYTVPQNEQPAPAPGHREQIGPDSPQHDDRYAAQLLAHAAFREHQAHYDRQRDTSPGAYLRHVLRGRA
jgi:hypothetical protein